MKKLLLALPFSVFLTAKRKLLAEEANATALIAPADVPLITEKGL